MPPRMAALIAHEVLHGLHYAHAVARDRHGEPLRVVHRDLSPSNVLLARTGEVKVSDFGVACALHDEDRHQTSRLIGSVGYHSPEQATCAPFDHRADLFGVGVLLYEMLAGERLFWRATPAATVRAVVDDEAPSLRRSGVAGWDRVLGRALAKSPADRYPSARAMADAIADAAGALPSADDLATFLRDAFGDVHDEATALQSAPPAHERVRVRPPPPPHDSESDSDFVHDDKSAATELCPPPATRP